MEKYSIRNVRPLIILTSSFLLISAMRFAGSYPIEWTEIFDSVWYASSANSFFHSFQLLIGGKFNSQGQPLYSILISPAYLFDSMSKTFIAIKLINSLVMSSTLFPVFLLARNFMAFSRAIVVALLSILIGPMFYTFTIMAENLHYPLCMWLVYLIYLSNTTKNIPPRLILGFLFGLAVLNKMSSSALLVGYIILLGLDPFTRPVSIKNLPSIYLKEIVRSGNVFVVFAITILPYIIWRIALNDNSSAVPYSDIWHRFFNNLLHFDILKYFKWVLVYFGQLNLSTGLFLLPISIIALISFFKSEEREKGFFALLVTVLLGCVLAVAVLQSGYNFGRLTERHFFVLTPLVFILSFFWLQGCENKKRVSKITKLCICITSIVATGFALFVPATTCWPAVDSAFYDALKLSANFAMQHGIGTATLRLLILLTSSLLIFYAGIYNKTMPYRVAVFIVFSFMLSINFLSYFQAVRHMQWVKNSRFPVTNCIDKSIFGPANLVFLLVPRYLAVDHIVWNKDISNKIFYQARTQIENPSDLVYSDYERLKKNLGSDRPTYFISQCLTFCGAKTIKKTCYGLDILKTSSPENLKICGFNLDFGAPYTHYVLKNGWSGNEGANPHSDGPTFVWATGKTADMNIYVENVDTKKNLCFRAKPYPEGQSVSVSVNGKNAGDFDVKGGWHKYCAVIHPGQLKKGENPISFKFKYVKSPAEDGGKDKRELAMAFDWLRMEDFTETH